MKEEYITGDLKEDGRKEIRCINRTLQCVQMGREIGPERAESEML